MIKRLLISGLVGFVTVAVLGGMIDYFEHEIRRLSYDAIRISILLCILFGLITTVVTFLKVKPKNAIIEDIIINKAKIIKAEQEKKLNTLR